jgi:hypothetical protein
MAESRNAAASSAQKVALRDLHPKIDRRRPGKDFNSLDAQREACAAFIQSQKHEGGWSCRRYTTTADIPAAPWSGLP